MKVEYLQDGSVKGERGAYLNSPFTLFETTSEVKSAYPKHIGGTCATCVAKAC